MMPTFSTKRLLAFSHDLCMLVVCWVFAYLLRFNLDLSLSFWPYLPGALRGLLLALCLHAPIYAWFGLYRGIWRYASVMDMRRIIFAVGLASLLVAVAITMLSLPTVPRSVLVLHPILLIMAMGGSRFAYRAWKDRALYGRLLVSGQPVLVLGAGDAAERLLRELAHSPEWCVVGLLTADPARIGRELQGVRILGLIDELPQRAKALAVQHAIVAMPTASAADRRRAIELAVESGLSVLTVPSLTDMLAGKVAISQIRQVQLEDLLGRDPVQLDDGGLNSWLGGQSVAITGAGGSIGSELVRQIAQFHPRQLVLIDISEFALYQLEQEFAHRYPDQSLYCVVGDVKDAALLDRVFAAQRPAVVFHAAAYKHVPLMEGDNAWQAVRNNVVGSRCVAQAACRHGVGKMVMISTDKAVNPTNVMGASKRLAERVLSSLPAGATRFVTVRFGNVLGSNGSVIPKFSEQIARGGPLTVTHPEIIRYFMLIPEAAQLVLQAGLMGLGGEIFVLEMGEPIRILDLARDMIRLSGFSEDEIGIEFTGLRPGEKLYEELLTDNECTLPTPHAKLRVARAEAAPDAEWVQALERWLEAPAPAANEELKRQLQHFVPEYAPQWQ